MSTRERERDFIESNFESNETKRRRGDRFFLRCRCPQWNSSNFSGNVMRRRKRGRKSATCLICCVDVLWGFFRPVCPVPRGQMRTNCVDSCVHGHVIFFPTLFQTKTVSANFGGERGGGEEWDKVVSVLHSFPVWVTVFFTKTATYARTLHTHRGVVIARSKISTHGLHSVSVDWQFKESLQFFSLHNQLEGEEGGGLRWEGKDEEKTKVLNGLKQEI